MIYVTGAGGQLGQTLCYLYPELTFFNSMELDISREDVVARKLEELSPGVVINCAAYTAVDRAEDEKDKAFLVNRDGVRNLAKYCSEFGHKLIHVSSDYVFDGSSNQPYCEEDKLSPLGIYGKSKLEGEGLISEYLDNYAIVRTSWVYSPFGANFFKTMLNLSSRSELNVVYDQIGSPTYTGDLAKVLFQLSQHPDLLKGDIFNYSNEGAISWYDFATEIMRLVKSECKVYPILSSDYPMKVTRPHYSVLNKSKIKKALNIRIPHWQDSLVTCLSLMEKQL